MRKIMFVFVPKGDQAMDGYTLHNTADEAWQRVETKSGNPRDWLMGQGHRVVRCHLDMTED